MTRRRTTASSRAATSASRTTAAATWSTSATSACCRSTRARSRGPVTVEGDGEHTVEYRSTDVAGNEEDVKSRHVHDRRRRRDAAGDDARARSGNGGRTTGPVTVRLSATDPEEPGGGGPAETHDVNALPSSWNPNTVQAATGDVVRWNFPEATAGAPHNVYLIQPDEAPDSAGHLVSDEVVLPGAPPVTATLDEAGTWTYVCKIHSHVENGHWTAWSAPPRRRPPAGPPARASISPSTRWTARTRCASTTPRATIRSRARSRCRRRASTRWSTGRRTTPATIETTKSVEFEIGAEDPDAPTVRGRRRPVDGRRAAAGAVLGHRPGSAEPPADLPVGLRRRRRHGQPEPAAHVHEGGQVHGDGDGHRRAGQDGHRHRRGRGHGGRQPAAGGQGASPPRGRGRRR